MNDFIAPGQSRVGMDAAAVRTVLDENPALESALSDVRDVDRQQEAWTFDDVPVDSGAFGELVNEGLVESVGDEYRVADPEVVDRALAGDVENEASGFEASGSLSLPDIDRTAAAVLAGLLALVAVFRASTYPAVFRDRVVFPANDPYYYVYLTEQSLQNGWSFGELPGGLGTQEPLTILQMLVGAELVGGLGNHTAFLAWLPVLVAIATGLVVYLFACEVTEDRHVALASVFVLAVLPVHVLRSSLGFIDHHAFDYFWLAIVAWGTVATFDLDSLAANRSTARAIGILAVGVAGSVLAWWAATLLLLPIAIAVVCGAAIAVRDDNSFLAPGLATAAGVGLGSVVILLTHIAWGWHEWFIAGVPVVLTLGIIGVVGATYGWRTIGLPAWAFPTTGIVGVAGVSAGVYFLAPTEWAAISRQVSRLFADREIAEMQSVFGAESMGWLFSFGLLLFVVIPAMGWGVYRAYRGDRSWLVASSYAWFMLALATLQARYAGELAPFTALFGGLALVALAERVDAARLPVPLGGEHRSVTLPDRDVTIRLVGVVLLVCGLSGVLAPIGAYNLTIPEQQYETASFIDTHAAEVGHEYPDNYVFSPWSWSRMYNYHVSGESLNYGYAQSNYRDFTFAADSGSAYERYIANGPAQNAYLVTEPIPGDPEISDDMMQSRLHDRYGSASNGSDGLAHYRALYSSPSGDYKAFRVVPGATIRGEANPGSTVTVETQVDIEGASFTYQRGVTATENGTYAVTVPYPGEYETSGGNATSVAVSESAVQNGENVQAERAN
jgi:dolichyl-diphosphooligosaccharide--protein glycosyltransferase